MPVAGSSTFLFRAPGITGGASGSRDDAGLLGYRSRPKQQSKSLNNEASVWWPDWVDHEEREELSMAITETAKEQVRIYSKAAAGLNHDAVQEIERELKSLLADTFALYMKTKNFHWHMSGSHFRDYHLLLDDHADQLFAMTDNIAERARKIGATTLRSIGNIATHQRLADNSQERVSAEEMLSEVESDNRKLTQFLRWTHGVCERHSDVATASLIEVWIDEAERRTWFLAEITGGKS